MKITIESTSKLIELNGHQARVWEGETTTGVQVICFISRIAVEKTQDVTQFKEELLEQSPPSIAAEGIPLRMII